MIFRKLRTIFSHRDDGNYDGDRRRDAYMDVLKQMQSTAPKQPSPAAREAAQTAIKSPRAEKDASARTRR